MPTPDPNHASTAQAASPATGPRTDAGKAVSARNATTHGLFARDVVLPTLGEDPAAYEALLQQLLTELPPRNMLERHYLEQIAAASWRLRRLHRWQAQVYEDPALTEDARLDRLDKTLRHENSLTRQIDRAVRTLNRDLKWLFEGRARDEAFYHRDLTPSEVRAEPELEIEVQRDIWRRLRPAPAPDLAGASLDNTAPPTHYYEDGGQSDATRNCQNGLTPSRESQPPTAPPPPPIIGGPGGPPLHARPVTRKCQNEPHPPQGSGNYAPNSDPVSLVHPLDEAFCPVVGRERTSVIQGGAGREHEILRKRTADNRYTPGVG